MFIQPGFVRVRLLVTQALRRIGLGHASFLTVLAVVVGLTGAVAGVTFHVLVTAVRALLFNSADPHYLYGRGIWLIVAIPAAGGLVVGLLRQFIFGSTGGHGVVDVIESVIRSRAFARPHSAFETIVLSGSTLGSGGSTGAEGPIVQIGAALASGVGKIFGLPHNSLALLVAAGAAAGISAIFNAPLGGVLFTLELILLDFSVRSLTPVVVASVVSNVAAKSIFHNVLGEDYGSIFPVSRTFDATVPNLASLGWVALAGLIAGLAGAGLTVSLRASEQHADRLRTPILFRPAVGGLIVGILGVAWVLASRPFTGGLKPFDPAVYPLPAFMGDGYGIIRTLISPDWLAGGAMTGILVLILCLLVLKTAATVITLGSGGVGGVIAPALFLGAAAGALVGVIARRCGSDLPPEICALAGMAGGLAAVIHAPLASALILVEVAGNYRLLLPGMLAVVVALTVARALAGDSIYTSALKHRGIRLDTRGVRDLHGRTLGELKLLPAVNVPTSAPAAQLAARAPAHLVVTDANGTYVGLLLPEDFANLAYITDAAPLLTAADISHAYPTLSADDDLATALDTLLRADAAAIAVIAESHVAGLLTRAELLRQIAPAE
jgi:CIC family chloride channel protein